MKKILFITLLFLTSFAVNRMAAAVIYVDSSRNTGLNNGTSWDDAFISFQSALDAAVSSDEIWVAKGTYKPSFDYGLGGGSRYYHFRMKNGVTIYGGFAGTETAVSQRTDFRAGGDNETILSGDLNDDDVITGAGATLSFSNNGENCYHVLYHPNGSGLNNTAMLDGFSITGGNANGTSPHNWGGGISNFTASISLNNVSIYNNFSAYVGGGISNFNSSPVITNFSMRYNSSLYGAMYSNVASPVMINGLISDNKGESAGGLCCNDAPHALTNVTITNNHASWRGGAMYCYWSDMTMKNCIIWGNTASDLGNQVFTFQNAAISFDYSCYANGPNDIAHDGGYSTNSNSIITDPMFANTAYKDYRIAGTSPCADAGNDSYIAELHDIRGTAYDRKLDKTTGGTGTVDMGAYEYKAGTDPLIPCNNPLSGGVIAGDQSICQGSLPDRISNTTLPSGYSGILEFKWQLSTTGNGSGFTDIPGANDSTFQPPVPELTTWCKRLARVDCMSDWIGAAESNVIQVTVNPVYAFTENIGICEGESLVWHDSTYATPGTYTKSYQTKQGCDSVFTLTLAVNPVYHFTEDRDICAGESILWQDSTYATTGTHMAIYETNKGCDSIYILNLTVHPLPMDLPDLNGLKAYYPFNGNANDESGHGHDGVEYGPTLTADKESNPNSAYSFDGANDYILIGDPVPAALRIQNEITLSAWIYATQYPSNNLGLIVGSQCDACGAAGASIFLDGRTNSDGQPSPPGHIHFQIGNGSWHQSNNNSQVPLNQWVHIVATRKANENAKIYFNGVAQPVTSVAWNGSVSYAGAFFAIGRQRDASNRFFNGQIDEVRVFNRSLSESEVQALYHASSVHVISDTLCENESTGIMLFTSQTGISYQLKKNGTEVGSPQAGNEATLTFPTGPLSSTTQFTIEATNTASACSIVLDTVLTITVNPLPTVTEASVTPESLCVSGQAVFSALASPGTISWYDAATDGNAISILNPVINTSTTYYAEATSPEGCVSLNRTPVTAYVHPAYFFPEVHEICNNESYTWHGNTYSVAGTYTTVYTTSNGCDSIYRLKLSVNPSYSFVESHVICSGDSYIWQGNTYKTSGTYLKEYLTKKGCDSTFTLNLTVNAVDISVVQNGNTLTAGVAGAGYRWLNCADDYSLLTDETHQNFNPAADGQYAVEITQNNCVDTSDCYSISLTGIDPLASTEIKLYPNPVTDDLFIEVPENDEWYGIEMMNANGQVVYQNKFMNKTSIPAGQLSPGVYMIKIEYRKTFTMRKIIKQ